MKKDLEILDRLFHDIPHEVTSLLNALYANYPDGLVKKALQLIDDAQGTDAEKARKVSDKLVKLGLSKSRANLLLEILIALGKFADTQGRGDNLILKTLTDQLNASTQTLNTAIENSKKENP
jgi:hypothetical protein